jgi:hypothetical protein
MAMHEDGGRPAGPYLESKYADLTPKIHEEAGSRLRAAVIVGAGATLTGGALAWRLKRWRSG